MGALSAASEYIRKGQVRIISVDEFRIITEVGKQKKYTVIYYKKNGRIEQSCSCSNFARGFKHSMCSHLYASAAYNVMKGVKL